MCNLGLHNIESEEVDGVRVIHKAELISISVDREPGFIHSDGRKCYGCQSCLSDLEEE